MNDSVHTCTCVYDMYIISMYVVAMSIMYIHWSIHTTNVHMQTSVIDTHTHSLTHTRSNNSLSLRAQKYIQRKRSRCNR